MAGELILLVDDEPNIIQLARMYLEREGFRVESASDGRSALRLVESQRPALVVLDLMLPELDGLEVCRQLRKRDLVVAILILSAKDEDVDRILGLEMGADDYLTKPFHPRELVARVKAILRRSQPAQNTSPESPLHQGDLVIDPAGREAVLQGEILDLRSQEFDLLYTLARHAGIVLTRQQLLDQAWGYDYAGQTRTVDVHVGRLRKKLDRSTVRIETVTGVGYKLSSE